MTHLRTSMQSRLLLAAGLAFGALAVQAAPGYTVRPADEAKVQVGMSQDEVRAALGRPEEAQHFVLSDSSTWTYRTTDPTDETRFQVDFDGQGRVISANQAMNTDGR